MSFYRNFIAAIATMGLATAVFAADENNAATENNANDQQQVMQTADSQAQNATEAAQPAATATDKVNINTATAKELMKVKGLNASKAKAIVSYRKKHGDFKTLDDLKEVKGFKKMNEKTMKEVEEQLTIG